MVYKKIFFALFLSFLLVFPACKKGKKITEKLRIVSVVPSSTEILFAIGAEEKIVGVSVNCDYPEDVFNIKKVGDYGAPSMEKIIALNPTLVILSPRIHDLLKESLINAGINVYVSKIETIEDIFREIKKFGELTGRHKNAEQLVVNLKRDLEKVKVKKPNKRIYIEISGNPLISIGRRSYINEMITLAGGENVFGEIDDSYPVIQQEDVIRRNPEIILIFHLARKEDIRSRLGWKNIDAIKNDKIYIKNTDDLILRPGPRFIDGIKRLKKIIKELS